ncbi:MAG TPA: hypothetical protein VGB13_01810 [Candidatus Krumholzibacteria bacterium]
MRLWHEPSDPLLAEFHALRLLTPEEWGEHYRSREREVRLSERLQRFAYWAFIAGSTLLVTFTAGRVYQAATTKGADYALVSRTIGNAEAALAVCGEADERLHEVLRERAGVVWRADEP